MPISATDLEAAIRAAMPVIHLEIEDTSNGCGENYAVFVVSEVSSLDIVSGALQTLRMVASDIVL